LENLKIAMQDVASKIEVTLDELMPLTNLPEARVIEAMRYSALGGGKRLRPFLVLNSARLFDVDDKYSLRIASALEMIHCYSLIHDDLPAMDDDDMRRGRPTNHKAFDEATAILAGDSLLTYAFEVLADEKTSPDAKVRCELVKELAIASGGFRGMVSGQMLDLTAGDKPDIDLTTISRLQDMKTGCLIRYACEAGAIIGKASDDEKEALVSYSKDIGLAFQITDDILDVEGDANLVGKALRKDEEAGKVTFVSLLGLDEAKARAKELVERANQTLDIFGKRAELLKQVANYILIRKS